MHSGEYGEGGKPPNILNIGIVHNDDIELMDNASQSQIDSQSQLNQHVSKNIVSEKSIYKNSDNGINKNSTGISTQNKDEFIFNNYDVDHTYLYEGPYYAYLQHENKNIGRLHEMVVGHILHKDLGLKKSIKEISRAGINRIKVEMHTVKDIINLVNNPLLKSKQLHCFVPKHLTERRGVVRYVDTSFSEEFLMENIESTSIVKQVKRVKKKIIKEDGSVVFADRQTIIITFEGNKTPPYVFINSCRREVSPYVYSVVRCFKCLRFGHVMAQCRSSEQRCKTCGITHEGDCEVTTPNCVHCQSNTHNALSKVCPSYQKEKAIKLKMAENNCSYKEAQNMILNPNSFANITANRFSLLADLNDHSVFPPISYNSRNRNTSSSPRPIEVSQNTSSKSKIINKKRKISDSNNLHAPQRQLDPRQLPLNPLPPNPYRPSVTNIGNENSTLQLVECITQYIYDMIRNTMNENNLEENDIRMQLKDIFIKNGSGVEPTHRP